MQQDFAIEVLSVGHRLVRSKELHWSELSSPLRF